MRRKKNKGPKFVDFDNWPSLQRGNIIKSIVGYGPEFLSSKTGIIEYMGEYGKIRVDNVDVNGIHGYNEDGSHVYLYMGKEHVSKTGTLMKPHKIKLLM